MASKGFLVNFMVNKEKILPCVCGGISNLKFCWYIKCYIVVCKKCGKETSRHPKELCGDAYAIKEWNKMIKEERMNNNV